MTAAEVKTLNSADLKDFDADSCKQKTGQGVYVENNKCVYSFGSADFVAIPYTEKELDADPHIVSANKGFNLTYTSNEKCTSAPSTDKDKKFTMIVEAMCGTNDDAPYTVTKINSCDATI